VKSLPGADVEVDRPNRPDGEWWFDVGIGDTKIAVSWRSDRGFGVYLGISGYGEKPSEIFQGPELVVRRLRELAEAAASGTAPSPMRLGQLRKLVGWTQADLANILRIGQANVSRIEGRSNPTLGSIRTLVEAMGGRLEVRVQFSGIDVPIALPSSDAEEVEG
jgi:DNA-binding XRE family transcriptional regulator